MQTTTLYYRQGGSDKVYQASIVPGGAGYHVTFAFGRRGSTLSTGSKTPQPVTLAEAQKLHAKLVREKQAKGYTEDSSGTPAPVMARPAAAARPPSAELPMLLNSITEAEATALLTDKRWCLQEKHDGKRMTLHWNGTDSFIALNKRGLPCGCPQAVADAVRGLDACILDGECVGDVFYAFDALAYASSLTSTTYQYRLGYIQALCDAAGPAVQMVETAFESREKVERWHTLRDRNAEGIVFKDLHAAWHSGRPNSGGPALKFKFVETASCIVGGSRAGKRSVELLLLDPAVPRLVGNVTIPPNHTIPPPDSVIEVRYLYAYPGGSLFQPVYLGPRDDVDTSECTIRQLKLKAA